MDVNTDRSCSFCGKAAPETQKLVCGFNGSAICDGCIELAHDITAPGAASTERPNARLPVLDHGYIEVVEHWGSDERIIEAARMSTNKGFNGWGPTFSCPEHGETTPVGVRAELGDHSRVWVHFCKICGATVVVKHGDEKLLAYLWKNRHATPFEMAGMAIEVKAPIMVFREWHRHRTQSYNEMSARYIPLPDENYTPTVERILMGAATAGANKQAQGSGGALTEQDALDWLALLAEAYEHSQRVYELGIKMGVPRELARLPVPVARYSRMRASTDLRNWLGFVSLRSAPNAQWEIRQFSDAVAGFLRERFPRTMAIYDGEAR